jgi:hypothetical protein
MINVDDPDHKFGEEPQRIGVLQVGESNPDARALALLCPNVDVCTYGRSALTQPA